MTDNVNHPQHYESQRIVLEPIDLCECFDFCIGNALKYLLRAGHKEGNPEEQDLAKARWYLNRALKSSTSCFGFRPVAGMRYVVEFATTSYSSRNDFIRVLFCMAESPGEIKEASVRRCIKLINEKIGEDK